MRKITHILIAAAAGVSLMGCRGEISTAPPVHLVQNMDFQDKLKAQSESGFEGWADKRGMRLPVKGTIARGSLGLHSEDADVEEHNHGTACKRCSIRFETSTLSDLIRVVMVNPPIRKHERATSPKPQE